MGDHWQPESVVCMIEHRCAGPNNVVRTVCHAHLLLLSACDSGLQLRQNVRVGAL